MMTEEQRETLCRSYSLDPMRIPGHVAIIMDGNGRWARKRLMQRTDGHNEGVNTVNRVTRLASDLGVKFLTLYAFSTENWNRPADEVDALMHLIGETILREAPELKANNVYINLVGNIERLPLSVQQNLREGCEICSDCTGMTLNLCLSYSSRQEILSALKQIASDCIEGKLSLESLDDDNIISQRLMTGEMPDPDLMIRTGGEQRISNFLLWQLAYTELYFTPILWPDFLENDFADALRDYQERERRFGKTSEQVNSTKK